MTEQYKEPGVLYFTRLHWVIFFWPVACFCIAIILQLALDQLWQLGLFLEAFALIWILMTWVTYYFSSVTIKKKQVILRTGILVRQTVDIPLNKIESIDIRQTIMGSIFKYGAVVITGTGGTKQIINYLDKPLTCRRYIEQLMNEPQ